MDKYRKNTILAKIINAINADKYGMKRYLQATPFREHDYYSFDGTIDAEVFFDCLYYENKVVLSEKKALYNKIVGNSGLNTFFVLGYQGCGKTTFINSLLNYYTDESKKSINQDYLIDCDKAGVDGESQPLKIIFNKKLLSYIINHRNTLYNYLNFYNDNHLVLRDCVNSTSFYKLRNFFKEFIDKKREISNADDINEMEEFVNKFNVKESLYIIILFYLSDLYNSNDRVNDPVFLFVDNLDYIDNLNELEVFIDAIKSLTTDLGKICHRLCLSKDNPGPSNIRFTEKVKILTAMRETTYANIPRSHGMDFLDDIHSYIDITEWYDKNKIIRRRLSFLRKSEQLSPSKKTEADLILKIISDKYTKVIFFPLYNNNYRRATKIISSLIIEHPIEFESYDVISKSDKQYLKHGSRGILFKCVFDLFNADNKDENCLKKIGVLDFQNRKTNEVSIARLLLSYLSNLTDTICDNPRGCVSIRKIIDQFEGIFTEKEIIRSILNMYSLKDSIWTHLVSFSRFESKESIKEMLLNDDYSGLDLNRTTVHYSCAGKIYLEVITSHFEFFSTRIKGTQNSALFCYSNYKKGSLKFLEIIESVFKEVELCCRSLSDFNNRIMNTKSQNGSQMSERDYLDSFFVASIKKPNRKDKKKIQIRKQFHEDRIINSHIGYIDRFRLYLLNQQKNNIYNPVSINKSLCEIIQRYVDLLKKVPLTDYTENELLPFYEEQLELNKINEYKEFFIPIKKGL